MFVPELELNLIKRMSNKLMDDCSSELVSEDEVKQAQQILFESNNCTKAEFCSSLETIYYIFSIILSEIRQQKREIMTAIFQTNPKLSQEKSVLKDKLDAEPEYAILHQKEELLFQFIEHIQNIKNNITYVYSKEDIYD